MYNQNMELGVGVFAILGVAALAYLTVVLADIGGMQTHHYELRASFQSTSGLKEGAFVEIAGVRVGKVAEIELDAARYESVVKLTLKEGVDIQEDAVASIRTAGIIGDKFVKITPGGSDVILGTGEELLETEPAISLEELVSKYIFSN